MIKIKNLTKSFQTNTVLKEIDLEIEPGKLTTLLGENGSGKSTLLNILAGHELPDLGSVTYNDVRLDQFDFPYVHDIFFVHEQINYNLSMTIGDYISILKEEVPNWDEKLFLKMVNDRKINLRNNFLNLSRGQKMQVVLMIGLASKPKILLLDEITSVIDVYGRKYFLDLLSKFVKEGNTVIITTNIVNELEFYTDNLIVLKNSKIVLNSKVKEIGQSFIKIRQEENVQHPIFQYPECVWAGVNSDRSVSYIVPKKVCHTLNIPPELLDKRQSTLEDIFIYFFKNDQEGIHEDVA